MPLERGTPLPPAFDPAPRAPDSERAPERGLALARLGHDAGSRDGSGDSSGDSPQVERRDVEDVGALVGADDDVLVSHAQLTGEVDAGLDAERRASLHRVAIARDQIWLLVALEPDPVSQAMEELRAVAPALD